MREIEDEIRHDYDSAALGLVTYEPALCVPYAITIDASATSLPADGVSTAMITATVRDVAGNYANPGTMIGITTSLGTVPYGYAEESEMTLTGPGWGVGPDAHASGGQYAGTGNVGDTASWDFQGAGISLVYLRSAGGGNAEVRVDGVLVKTINMLTSVPGVIEWLMEDVVTSTLGSGMHTIEVKAVGGGPIWVDSFRSGGVVASQGRVFATLTASTTPGLASVQATVYDGRIVRSDTPVPFTYPWLTAALGVQMEASDLQITKLAAPSSINRGQEVTYTIQYNNVGPQAATGTLVTDTLPADFIYVRSTSVPSLGAPTSSVGNEWVFSVGTLAQGATGAITVVAKPDPSLVWPTPVVRTNWVATISAIPAKLNDRRDRIDLNIAYLS